MLFYFIIKKTMKKYVYCFFLVFSAISLSAQKQVTNLPTLFIQTENNAPVVEKEKWLNAALTIVSSESSECITDVATEVRGRGNSTWGMAKKPYRLKLNKKASLLGLPAKAKNWVLLANYCDKSLIRNAVAFEISQQLDLEFSPSVRFVDVVLNGEYMGNYMMSDQVEVKENRVPVEEQEPEDTEEPAITGGYLLELDGFAASEPVWFQTPKGVKVTIKYPKDDEINTLQRDYITQYTQAFENRLFASDFSDPATGYRALVDTTTLIDWYIACELTGNSDSFWSIYVYKKRENPLFYFGPLWDFDIAFNNDNRLGDATRKLMREHAHEPKTWIQQMWKDAWFRGAVDRRWKELRAQGLIEHLINYIDRTVALIDGSQIKNFEKWNILNQRVYLEYQVRGSHQNEVEYLKTYLRQRAEFLDTDLVGKEETPSEPFVPANFYYRVMNKRTSNVLDVEGESAEVGAPLILWNAIDGRLSQNWQVVPAGEDVFCFINRSSGLAMKADGRGNPVVQAAYDENDDLQTWRIAPVNTGNMYGIVNLATGYSLNNKGGSFENGTAAILWDNNIAGSQNQQWFLQKAEVITATEEVTVTRITGVYPNPACVSATLAVEVPSATAGCVSVSSWDGRQRLFFRTGLLEAGIHAITLPLDRAGLTTGIYFVEFTTDAGGRSVTKLLVKN